MKYDSCEVYTVGRMAYADALALQNRLVEERGTPAGIDRLLLVEHPHTYTLGSAGHEAYLLMAPDERERLGITVYRTDRGGDITYLIMGRGRSSPTPFSSSRHLSAAAYAPMWSAMCASWSRL
ncbi:MAG: hypothetical protein U0670_03650 [Anaerolineae bacterium]